jgi:outer membrane protein OmpA-like peptidoglycan-associated protein
MDCGAGSALGPARSRAVSTGGIGRWAAGTGRAGRRRAPEPERESSGWWKWLLLGLGLLGLLWYVFGRGQTEEVAVAPAETAVVETVAPPADVAPAPVPEGAGVIAEDRVGKPALVVFFAVGESAVTNDLAGESGSLKAYVDANANSRISVSGFNDPTGNAAQNAELSKNRAEQVKAALVAAGFPADRIDLDKPVAPTDTSDSYAAARRVDVTIKD